MRGGAGRQHDPRTRGRTPTQGQPPPAPGARFIRPPLTFGHTPKSVFLDYTNAGLAEILGKPLDTSTRGVLLLWSEAGAGTKGAVYLYPVKDVIPGSQDFNIGAPPGKEDEILPLPAAVGPHHSGVPLIVSRWRPTLEERAAIAAGGDVFLCVFSRGMVPVMLTTDQPIIAGDGHRMVILTPDHPDYAGLTAPPGIGG